MLVDIAHVPFSRATTELPLFTAYNLFQRITMWKTSESSLTLLASNSTFYVPVEDKDQTKMNKINEKLKSHNNTSKFDKDWPT